MTQKVKTVKEFVKENNELFEWWKESGLLENLSKEDAIVLAKLFQEIADILTSDSRKPSRVDTVAIPVARICFDRLSYLIQNPIRFVQHLDQRFSQDEAALEKETIINFERSNGHEIEDYKRFDWEAEFCWTLANETKAMKL